MGSARVSSNLIPVAEFFFPCWFSEAMNLPGTVVSVPEHACNRNEYARNSSEHARKIREHAREQK